MDTGFVTLRSDRGQEARLRCALTPRQKAILLAGGLLEYTKEGN